MYILQALACLQNTIKTDKYKIHNKQLLCNVEARSVYLSLTWIVIKEIRAENTHRIIKHTRWIITVFQSLKSQYFRIDLS